MREIKFRAWSKTAKVMHPKWEVLSNEGGEYILMQFTGLLDKNGKEIYEGDIVGQKWTRVIQNKEGRKEEPAMDKFLVEYSSCGFTPFAFAHFGDEVIDSSMVEIIGNIHENKELLT